MASTPEVGDRIEGYTIVGIEDLCDGNVCYSIDSLGGTREVYVEPGEFTEPDGIDWFVSRYSPYYKRGGGLSLAY